MSTQIVAMVLAGGEGKRLYPLTGDRSKPAVPFAGRYRIVDFVLSNLLNSGVHAMYLLVQYKSQSLIDHIRHAWALPAILPEHFVTVVPPQMREGPEWFQGTADAVHQNLNLIEYHGPELVAVFGADHVYRMDVRQMIRFHLERDAAVSVAAVPVPIEHAPEFGVITAEADGRIRSFDEKPKRPAPMPGDAARAYASMGNYLFRTEALVKALNEARNRNENDFGRHILPRLLRTERVYAYDFARNRVPGLRDYEEPAYWRDIGTIDAFYDAHQDVLGREPRFNLFNPQWVVRSADYQGPVARVIDGEIRNCIIGDGALVKGGRLTNTVVRREVVIEADTEIEDCIIMDYTVIRRGARLKRAIVDRYNTIEPGCEVGIDREADRQRHFVTDSGIVVVSKGPYRPDLARYH